MNVIDEYIKQFDQPVQNELERIRSIAQRLLPGSTETITYGMPTIQYKGKSIIGFLCHKHHIGIYPFSGQVISEIAELKNYSTSKGAVQEKFDQLLPDALVEKIINHRLRQANIFGPS